MNKQSIDEKEISDAVKPPVRDVFLVGLLGLPLNLKDNIVCGMMILLAVVMQIRLSNTLLGEGWLALFGFAAYVAMRLWLLKRRFPLPGEIVVEAETISLPASVNSGFAQVVAFSDCKRVVVWFFKGKGGGFNLTSIELITDRQNYRITMLMADLNMLERSLARRGLPVTRAAGSFERMVGPVMLVLILLLVLFMTQTLLR